MNKNEVILHGEVMVFPVEMSFSGMNKKKIDGGHLIVADSETTGNHHVIDVVDGVDIYEHDNKLYMNSSVPTKIRCVHTDRHDAIEIPPGSYEFGTQQEYDPFAARMQNVRD